MLVKIIIKKSNAGVTPAGFIIFMVMVDSYNQTARWAIMNCVIHLILGKGNPKTAEWQN